jgi:hypothetical protein
MPFETNVFINCPFDEEYKLLLLRPLLFTILYLDFEPKISQTKSSSEIRINQIKRYIKESKFGIHDLSRCKPLKRKELPRFNMPYELGLDVGCHEYGGKKFKDKKILVLETDKYHYLKVLSDIAGQDIENHGDDPKILVRKIRNWFSTVDETNTYPSANEIWIAYNQFDADLNKNLLANNYTSQDIDEMPNGDFVKFVKDWIRNFKY